MATKPQLVADVMNRKSKLQILIQKISAQPIPDFIAGINLQPSYKYKVIKKASELGKYAYNFTVECREYDNTLNSWTY